MIYQSNDDKALNKRIRADQEARQAKRYRIMAALDAGKKEILRSDFDQLEPKDKLKYARMGIEII